MEMRCTYHLDREALSACASCGLHFCNKCLHKGGENYFCDQPECKERWLNIILPAEMDCPFCGVKLELDEEDRCNGEFDCPACKTHTDLSSQLERDAPEVLLLPPKKSAISEEERLHEKKVIKDLNARYSVKNQILKTLILRIPDWLKKQDDDYIPD